MHQSYPADLYKSVCNLQLEASRQKTNLILEMKGTCHPITKYYNASLGIKKCAAQLQVLYSLARVGFNLAPLCREGSGGSRILS